jgi:hypothetical protein
LDREEVAMLGACCLRRWNRSGRFVVDALITSGAAFVQSAFSGTVPADIATYFKI